MPPASAHACGHSESDCVRIAQGNCPGWADSAHPGWICAGVGLQPLAVNEAAVRSYGFSHAEFLRMSLADLEVADAENDVRERIGEAAWDTVQSRMRRHRLKSGDVVDIELFTCPAHRSTPDTVMVFARDVTEREQARHKAAALGRKLQLAEVVFERSSDAVTITDHDNRIVAVNEAFTRITGYEQAEVLGENPRVLASGRQDRFFYQEMWRSILSHGSWEGEIWNRRKNGECYPEWIKISAVRDPGGRVTHHVAMFSDISKAKAAEAQIHQLAFYDTLTGLPNRASMRDRMAEAIRQANRNGGRVGVLFIDLDRFKLVNDSLGHHVGDELLKEVGRRLRDALRATDTVARLGGDEFLVLLPDIGQANEVGPIAGALVRRVSEPLTLEGHRLRITLSIGITVYPDDAVDYDMLLRNADAAMYEAKRVGRSGYHFYQAELHRSAAHRLQMEADLRHAIEAGELQLHYQPQVDLSTGAVLSYEALVRWQHPRRGLVAPDQFIALAEETGLVMPLGQWVLRTACRQNRAWQDAGRAALPIAVNVSAQEFQGPQFFDTIATVLTETRLPASCLELELTESIVMNDAQSAIELLHRLRALGVRLAIDDFGTGYSSLGYLRRLPVNKLKIDRTFIRGIEHETADRAIAHTIITLARSLRLEVVAEGVETAGQARVLREHGCQQAQGYYYGRPVPDPNLLGGLASA